ncbi:MAG: NAD-binding protein, partial [Planctomycetota bacterium]
MRIGVPTEIKSDESRVSVMPVGVQMLTGQGHEVFVQQGAGEGSGFEDAMYIAAGATMLPTAGEVFEAGDMIVKVKEPQPAEIAMFKSGQTVFTYFHFAADEDCTRGCIDANIVAVAYETVVDKRGTLPLLTPMSEIAGRMSAQEGAKYLERPNGGRGVLLGGVPGVPPASVVVLGGGVVGHNAAKIAAGLGASVRLFDINLDRLRYLDDTMPANVKTVFSDPKTIADYCRIADLVIGAVLIPGAKAPKLV